MITQLLSELKNETVSDLFLTEGKCPKVRRLNKIESFSETPLSKEDFLQFFESQLPEGSLERLEKEMDLDLGISLSPLERFRINLGFDQGALSLVARKVPSGALPFESLGLPPILASLAQNSRGLILVTGSTGSGKSTTMASLLHYINHEFQKHIVTIEDPIEFIHQEVNSHITQREIGSDTKDFAKALKAVVRQSPDVIFIGELRDLETIQTALAASMTGHLVIATLHTVDAEQSLERMINYVPENLQSQFALDLSIALKGIISQRLVPKLDGSSLIPTVEVLINSPLIAKLISQQDIAAIGDALNTHDSDGMISFKRSLQQMVLSGAISPATALAASTNHDEMKLLLEGMETGIDSLRNLEQENQDNSNSMKELLKSAIHYGASDMLLSVGNPPILRINGDLLELNQVSKLSNSDTRNLLFSVLSRHQRAEFEQNKELDFALSITLNDQNNTASSHRFRVNGFFQKGSISCAIRVINQHIPNPEQLRLSPVVLDLGKRPHGLVLITGPTGHGKSTSLACLIDQINQNRSCHIITIEDPIEYVHNNKKAIIEQRELHADTHSYAQAMKYILRQDPDVILIGEMRDPETISAALTAAETGHLVLATLHTNDAVQTVDRIIDSFPPHHQGQIRSQLSACLEGVIAQRLLPRADTSGRIAVFEIMLGNTAVRALIRDGKTHQIKAAMETAQREGMNTMDKSLLELYNEGLISRQTVKNMALDKNLI